MKKHLNQQFDLPLTLPIKHLPSAGGVVFRNRGGQIEFLLVCREAMNDVSLPKGMVEPGESLQQAAVREIREEAGAYTKPEKYLGSVSYSSFSNNKKIRYIRTVHWFLMRLSRVIRRGPDSEIRASTWLTAAAARRALSYPSDREVIEVAFNLLSKGRLR